MTPIKREQADVQEILNHPIESHQPTLRYKKEGLWGWLSYLGFSMTVVLFLAYIVGQFFSYITRSGTNGIVFPFYEENEWIFVLLGLGLIFTFITIFKTPYEMKSKTRFISSIIFFVLWFVLEVAILIISDSGNEIPVSILFAIILLWVFLLGWYIRYFYKKSKDGYRRIWFKVFVFSMLPFLPFLYYRYHENIPFEENYMGDVLYDPSDYGYPNEW